MQKKREDLISTVNVQNVVESAARTVFNGKKGEIVYDQGAEVGILYETESAIACYLYNLVAPDLSASGGTQTTRVFERIDRILRAEALDFSHLVRTWFYLDHILD